MVYFLQLQRLGIADIRPVVGAKGYVIVVAVDDHEEFEDLLLRNPMWPVEEYDVLAVREVAGGADGDRAAGGAVGGSGEENLILARPRHPVPERANVAETRALLKAMVDGSVEGRMYEIVEDAGFGFAVFVDGYSHDDIMRWLFRVPLGNWGEFSVLPLGSLEAEHEAVMTAGMVPAGSLKVGNGSQPKGGRADTGARRRARPERRGRLQVLDVDELRARLAGNTGAIELVDVRSEEEFRSGHVEGAQLVPMDDLPEALERWAQEPPGRQLVFICERGNRSLLAARAGSRVGVDSGSLRGGVAEWASRGLQLIEKR